MAEQENGMENNSLETILIKSIHTLVYEKNIHAALGHFLETICRYYRADRAYVFEIDMRKQVANNTFEWCMEGIEKQKENLQGISMDILAGWMKKFRENGEFTIKALEQEVSCGRTDIEILQQQGISSLMAVPLTWDDEIMGFLGVDNPAENAGNMTLLRSVADFVTADLEKRRLIDELRQAGSIDMLTGMKNRNEYIWKFNKLKERIPRTLGVVFVDINGLKQMNDTRGHEYGDAMIREVAKHVEKYAPGDAYRIGGDEFVILWDNMEEEQFHEKTEKLKAEIKNNCECSISMGCVWQEGDIHIQEQVKQADALMYEAKRAHYQKQNYDRRGRR